MLLTEQQLAILFTRLAAALDIADQLYEEATLKYEEVGVWLAAEESALAAYTPLIYPQGSFRLGTVVRPFDPSCDYDIDLVCQLDLAKEATTQKELKQIIGDRLKQHQDLARRLSPSRRCWNLDFPRQFHMDVLPAILNPEQIPNGILLTDTDLLRWQKSNPKDYASWFHEAMAVQFGQLREQLAKSLNASVEDVPEWRIKTPLQIAVQLLKRHRDQYFANTPENRPVSIIITTLAARAYQSENNAFDALRNLVRRMSRFIEYRNGNWWVENPVEPGENFADKWNEKPEKRNAFLHWLNNATNDVDKIIKTSTPRQLVETISAEFGDDLAKTTTMPLLEKGFLTSAVVVRPLPTIDRPVNHVQPLRWPTRETYKVEVVGSLYTRRNGKRISELARRRIPKNVWLRFEAKTNAPRDYDVQWQVVNTGEEAKCANQLRGEFYPSDSGSVRWETTQYSGVHWVEAFIIKHNTVVARSGKRIVNVA
ncbi:MAG: nucleotide-binding domain-containing protein [Terriglobales bacterium]